MNAATGEPVVRGTGEEQEQIDHRYDGDRHSVADDAAYGGAEKAHDDGHEHKPWMRLAIPSPDPAAEEEHSEAEDVDQADKKGGLRGKQLGSVA